ncbi:DUF2339 domain-containing protein [Rhizobium sp. SL42]|uniref:DUF2339 domain-containing protein n=1 Tax=Rhizobium sp. SL42 TaxID=2806346 RepID=UPI001F3C922A|nr:DUF2339 domain-containing protein [Rhizobium sp. SL42]UJW76641.1 DUF2339 domain-containing protein [Rhizobium sp. SL42]
MLETLVLILVGILFVTQRGASKRISKLEHDMASLNERLAMPLAAPAVSPETAPSLAPKDVGQQSPEQPPVVAAIEVGEADADRDVETSEHAVDVTPASAADAETIAARTPSAGNSDTLENLLGARWAVWAGGLALALGGLFLVRYSIESGLLGPAVRLTLAALFGLLLFAGGELVRRKALPKMAALHENAMIPGILTAAGALTLFGAIYAAHGVYDFIGATTAFLLLSLVAFAVLSLSMLHGQALAGLGLAGSMITPALVSSTSPSPWTLFGFLTVSLIATAAASRFRGWNIVPSMAHAGLGLWALVYIAFSEPVDLTPATLALIAMVASWLLIWPGTTFSAEPDDTAVSWENLGKLAIRGAVGLDITMALAVLLPALAFLLVGSVADLFPLYASAVLIASLAAAGAARHGAFWPTVLATSGAVLLVLAEAALTTNVLWMLGSALGNTAALPSLGGLQIVVSLGLGGIFLLLGLAFIRHRGASDPIFATLWAGIAVAVPTVLAAVSFVFYGVYSRDWTHGIYGIAVGLVLIAAAEVIGKIDRQNDLQRARDLLVAGSFAALAFALHALTDGIVTTILLSVLGFAFLMATRLRPWSGLPWMMAAASVGVLLRIGWEPTLVGADALGRTPLFNALLPGYGIPALLAAVAAYELRQWPGARVRNALQAIASLLGLLAVAILIRHAMNGGVLDDSVPTLGEQSIYTLLFIGLSGIMMTLDLKSPSPVFRYGSMAAGVISMLQVLTAHLGALNPFFTGENTGNWPLINLLLIGYLLPGLAYAGLALYARDKRPLPYVTLLAVSGAALGFAWVTLSVRRFWQGEFIAEWKGFLQAETYSYSVAWLMIGVGLLVLGSRLNARSLRIASAVLVMLSVGKAFLIDMSNLEGVLRALSFIGLGAVLIGIGLFYQKILSRRSSPSTGIEAETGANLPAPTEEAAEKG